MNNYNILQNNSVVYIFPKAIYPKLGITVLRERGSYAEGFCNTHDIDCQIIDSYEDCNNCAVLQKNIK